MRYPPPPVLFQITTPTVSDRGPRYMQDVFAALRQTMDRRDVLQLEYGSRDGEVGIFLRVDGKLANRVQTILRAKYPNATVTPIEEGESPPQRVSYTAELTLEPSLFPLLKFEQFEDMLERKLVDPTETLLAAVRQQSVEAKIEIAVSPATAPQHRFAIRAVKRLDRPFFRSHPRLAGYYQDWITKPWLWLFVRPLGLLAVPDDGRFAGKTDVTGGRQGDRTDDLQAAGDKVGGHLYHARIRLVVVASAEQAAAARDQLQTMYAAFASLTVSRLALFRLHSQRTASEPPSPLKPTRRHSFFLSHVELATLFHPATAAVQTQHMARTPFTQLPPPVSFAAEIESGGVVLGQVCYQNDRRVFGLAEDDRRRHLYIVGRTGVGKTTLLENLIRGDIEAGRGVCLIDPHGDLADRTISAIPPPRTNDVVVFDPGDPEYAVGFNPLATRPGSEDLVASGVVMSFKKIFDSWGPRLADLLRNTVYLAIANDGTLMDVLRILTDDAHRTRLLQHEHDSVLHQFWTLEFAAWNDRYRTEAVAAILNKVRPFLMNKSIRAIVSQSGKGIDLREIMDEGRVLIVKLSKGILGEDNANLLGALLVTKLQQDAMSRADTPEEERRDFYLYIDEFQNFTTGAFATILSEARKYRLAMTIAHQYIGQLSPNSNTELRDAVFGNVGSIIAFQVGTDDAQYLSAQLRKYDGQLTPEDLANLPKYHAYVRLLQNGMPTHPFSMRTLAPQPITEDRTGKIRRASNERYATRDDV